MKILMIGGTGVISSACSKLAVEKGNEVYLLNRGNRNAFFPKGAHQIKADINHVEEVKKAISGMQFDSVVNWIAFTPDQVERDIALFADCTSQYILISSASAYQKPVTHYYVDESTPLANPYWDYSRNKIACEELVLSEYRKNGFPGVIVRPSYTYNEQLIPAAFNSWQNEWSLIDRMLKGKPVIIHGDGNSLWTMTHNTDFAKGFIGLLGNVQSIGHAFHITSDEVLTWNQIYEAIAAAVGIKINIEHMSSDFIIKYAPQYEGALLGDKAASIVFNTNKIKRLVPDFVSTVQFARGIKQSVEYYKSHPEMCSVDEEWDRLCDKMIENHR